MTKPIIIDRPYYEMPAAELEALRVSTWNTLLALARANQAPDEVIFQQCVDAQLEQRARVADAYAAHGNRPPAC
jgi:hypothetical protein